MRKATLFRKYALIISSLTGGSLLLSGVLNIHDHFEESKHAMISVQREKAEAASARIGEYLLGVEQRIAATATPTPGVSALEQRIAEIQHLKGVAAIREIALLDPQGKEVLKVSRRAADVLNSGKDYAAAEFFRHIQSGRPYRSPVYFRDGGLYMTEAMIVGPTEAGITVSEIDLEFLLDGITRIKVGESGYAYAVDSSGRLIAHPNIGLVLKDTSFAALPQVQQALESLRLTAEGSKALTARSYDGEPVLAAFGTIPQFGWLVLVEEPLAEAYRPLYAHALRSGLMVLVGMMISVLASIILIRRMVSPISALQAGTKQIGDGDLGHRISVSTGDELEALADGFNQMADQLQKSYATLEKKVEERTHAWEELNTQLIELSATDALTGIANRRRFDQVLVSEWSRGTRTHQPLALAMLDVDWFKRYNDHYGHQAGDECLRQIARVLAATVCRTGDLVARYGGEEFVFIAPVTDGSAALVMAQRVCESLQALALPHAESEFAVVTVSIGVAVMIPEGWVMPEVLLGAADKALYLAKQQGRNRVVLA
jgi:diguanylate cyclase (GGDEF)-like protein